MAAYGTLFDPWQENVFEGSMGERADGMWAAKQVGVSAPRQNGKGTIEEGRALAGLFLFGERLIVCSAHEARTAQMAFQRLKAYFENFDDLRRQVANIGNAVAREYIRLRSGQEVKFVTRSKSAIRGFSADCLLLDEAQILNDMAWEAILYTVSARPNHQIWLLGTPPLSLEDGVVFDRFRRRGMEGKDHRSAWFEWSAEPGCDLDDPAAWAQANPALGDRIHHETVVAERSVASDEGFARERLGMWSEGLSEPVFDMAVWGRLADLDMAPPARVALVVDVSPDRKWSCIGYAGQVDGGRVLVACESRPGTDWVTPMVGELLAARDVAEVALFVGGQAKVLEPDFVAAEIEYEKLSRVDMGAACGAIQEAVKTGRLVHGGQRELDAAVANAKTRMVGEHEQWDRRDPTIDISPLVAVSGAVWRWRMLTEQPYDLLASVR